MSHARVYMRTALLEAVAALCGTAPNACLHPTAAAAAVAATAFAFDVIDGAHQQMLVAR